MSPTTRFGVWPLLIVAGAVFAAPVCVAAQTSELYLASKPGLYEVRGGYEFTAEGAASEQTVLLPLPLSRVGQVPVTYELVADPPTGVARMHVRADVVGNYVAEVVLAATAEATGVAATVRLDWTALVLGAPADFEDLPERAPIPAAWPDEVQPWLASTRFVQAEHPEILAVATEIRESLKRDARDVLALTWATLERAQKIRATQEGRCVDLGAVQALTKQGSCTSAANLLAALLRANQLPARIVSGYATWYGPHQTHYVVEVWVPKFGWYPVEPTMGQPGWAPYRQIQVAVIPPEYEQANAGARFNAGAGVPYLSLTEYPGEKSGWSAWGTVDAEKNCDHVATPLAAYQRSSKQWAKGLEQLRSAWEEWLEAAATPVTSREIATRLGRDAFGEKEIVSLKAVLKRASKR